ncbi:hypothetical protein RQP54_04845 [Curvibacter sp. APW13]|uniref:hypothetical protein n=1 Tax=Curvibacter sp. APW13 TaxID=3077236 RepID=UPI0028DDD54B|nr:hypothetical protein [Curvibacter sp. APW13]MDT8990185.1 hypothetical protein [Curvibacter sp. APW13]
MHQHLFLHYLNSTICQTICRYLLVACGLLVGFSSFAESSGRIDSGTGSRFGDSWQEEVLLEDGRIIVVDRSQSYGGGHEIGQRSPVRDMTITFTLPSSGRRISWFSEYSEDVGRANFTLAALHLLKDTPYVVALPNLCQSYNKWGRPNPPYVVFINRGSAWERIPLAELPMEFKAINLVVESFGNSTDLARLGKVSSENVKQLNEQLKQPEYRRILREPIGGSGEWCEETFPNGKGRALGAGWFRLNKDLPGCMKVCQQYEYGAAECPCNKFFKEN